MTKYLLIILLQIAFLPSVFANRIIGRFFAIDFTFAENQQTKHLGNHFAIDVREGQKSTSLRTFDMETVPTDENRSPVPLRLEHGIELEGVRNSDLGCAHNFCMGIRSYFNTPIRRGEKLISEKKEFYWVVDPDKINKPTMIGEIEVTDLQGQKVSAKVLLRSFSFESEDNPLPKRGPLQSLAMKSFWIDSKDYAESLESYLATKDGAHFYDSVRLKDQSAKFSKYVSSKSLYSENIFSGANKHLSDGSYYNYSSILYDIQSPHSIFFGLQGLFGLIVSADANTLDLIVDYENRILFGAQRNFESGTLREGSVPLTFSTQRSFQTTYRINNKARFAGATSYLSPDDVKGSFVRADFAIIKTEE